MEQRAVIIMTTKINKLSSKDTYNIKLEDLNWKPIHPNNLESNPIEGYYCIILHKLNDNTISGRKYSILFQHEEISMGLIDRSKIERYNLFEKSYSSVEGNLDYDAPRKMFTNTFWNDDRTFSDNDINSYGSFVRSYDNIEDAKARALGQYKAVYGYALSFIEEE